MLRLFGVPASSSRGRRGGGEGGGGGGGGGGLGGLRPRAGVEVITRLGRPRPNPISICNHSDYHQLPPTYTNFDQNIQSKLGVALAFICLGLRGDHSRKQIYAAQVWDLEQGHSLKPDFQQHCPCGVCLLESGLDLLVCSAIERDPSPGNCTSAVQYKCNTNTKERSLP